MSYDLEILAQNRKKLLFCEVGGLVHNLGKMCQEFIFSKIENNEDLKEYGGFSHQYIVGILLDYLDENQSRLKQSAKTNEGIANILEDSEKNWLKDHKFNLPKPLKRSTEYCLGDFIELQDSRWYTEKNGRYVIIELFSDGSPATDLLESSHDAASGGEKQEDLLDSMETGLPPIYQKSKPVEQLNLPFYTATVFGIEKEIAIKRLKDKRLEFVSTLQKYVKEISADELTEDFITKRLLYLSKIKASLISTVADTRRPINDITLWDISYSVASLLKASLAHALLQKHIPERSKRRWRLLSISFDGLGFTESAYRITDLLGRYRAISNTLDQLRSVLEVKFPAANEIYRDEYGSIYVIPDVMDVNGKDLLDLTVDENDQTLIDLLLHPFQATMKGELQPDIQLWGPYDGKQINIADALKKRQKPNRPMFDSMQGWWNLDSAPTTDLCTVCNLRSQGFGPSEKTSLQKKAKDRKVCCSCLQRRVARSEHWMATKHDDEQVENDMLERQRTIWLNEVADENGYAALVVGRFQLKNWVSGTEIRNERKLASFARIQRVWRTTSEFWRGLVSGDPFFRQYSAAWFDTQLPYQKRVRIEPKDVRAIEDKLGDFHIYEARCNDRSFSLVWHPKEKYFLTADNLDYLLRQWQIGELSDWITELNNAEINILECSGYAGYEKARKPLVSFRVQKAEQSKLPVDSYKPYVRILETPEMFMSVIPGNKALDIAAMIKAKYCYEMGKVQDRLPLILGLVYFGRRTPLRAVIDTGRRMVDHPLEIGSYFDYEFLDSSTRRFEVFYNEAGGRVGEKEHRPYKLAEIDTLRTVWHILNTNLSMTQIRAIHALIERKRLEWQCDQTDLVFNKFVTDVFENAVWLTKKPQPQVLAMLKEAALTGMLSDVIELYLAIGKEQKQKLAKPMEVTE